MDQLSGSQKRGDQGAARVWSAAVRWLDIPGPGTTGIVLAALAVLVVTLAAAPDAPAADTRAAWLRAPVVPDLGGRTKQQFLRDVERGRRLKVRSRVFAKVGDSNTEATPVLYGLACEKARLAGRHFLSDVIDRYSRIRVANEDPMAGCRPWNSFSRRSAAVQSGSFSNWSLRTVSELPNSGYYAAPEQCDPDETPLTCELRIMRPRYVFVMTGSNDIRLDYFSGTQPGSQIGARLGPMIKMIRERGSTPVLSTIPPIPRGPIGWDGAVKTNEGI